MPKGSRDPAPSPLSWDDPDVKRRIEHFISETGLRAVLKFDDLHSFYDDSELTIAHQTARIGELSARFVRLPVSDRETRGLVSVKFEKDLRVFIWTVLERVRSDGGSDADAVQALNDLVEHEPKRAVDDAGKKLTGEVLLCVVFLRFKGIKLKAICRKLELQKERVDDALKQQRYWLRTGHRGLPVLPRLAMLISFLFAWLGFRSRASAQADPGFGPRAAIGRNVAMAVGTLAAAGVLALELWAGPSPHTEDAVVAPRKADLTLVQSGKTVSARRTTATSNATGHATPFIQHDEPALLPSQSAAAAKDDTAVDHREGLARPSNRPSAKAAVYRGWKRTRFVPSLAGSAPRLDRFAIEANHALKVTTDHAYEQWKCEGAAEASVVLFVCTPPASAWPDRFLFLGWPESHGSLATVAGNSWSITSNGLMPLHAWHVFNDDALRTSGSARPILGDWFGYDDEPALTDYEAVCARHRDASFCEDRIRSFPDLGLPRTGPDWMWRSKQPRVNLTF